MNSGVYCRYWNEDSDEWDNECFEDLPKEEQNKILDTKDKEWIKRLVQILAKTINELEEDD